jgi:hypothetical protein
VRLHTFCFRHRGYATPYPTTRQVAQLARERDTSRPTPKQAAYRDEGGTYSAAAPFWAKVAGARWAVWCHVGCADKCLLSKSSQVCRSHRTLLGLWWHKPCTLEQAWCCPLLASCPGCLQRLALTEWWCTANWTLLAAAWHTLRATQSASWCRWVQLQGRSGVQGGKQ